MKRIRIGTRDSELAVWQATLVQSLLKDAGVESELIYIKSEGDVDLVTPLYALGVQGIFTKTLDAALLSNKIDIAVHSMKDVPTQLAQGIQQAAVLKRGNYKDIFVAAEPPKSPGGGLSNAQPLPFEELANALSSSSSENLKRSEALPSGGFGWAIATSSVRRIAQWLNRYPNSTIENLRGNVNTRLRKLNESNWHGAIFAAAGLERINLRPEHSIDLDWMLPAPAQGAIMVVCREGDDFCFESCATFNDESTATCTQIEKNFLKTLMGGCSTPISALAEIKGNEIYFRGSILSTDGKQKAEVEKTISINEVKDFGEKAAKELLANGGQAIAETIRKKGLTADGEA